MKLFQIAEEKPGSLCVGLIRASNWGLRGLHCCLKQEEETVTCYLYIFIYIKKI